MNVALVEHAENDVDGEQRAKDDQPHAAHGLAEIAASPAKAVRSPRGRFIWATASSIAAVPCSSEVPAARLKVTVIAGTTPDG